MNEMIFKAILTEDRKRLRWYQELTEVEKSHVRYLMNQSFEAGKDDAMEGHNCSENVIYP